jgi:two-component system LytT family response regulator
MLLKALVIDDEELARSSMVYLLQEYCPEIRVIGSAGSAKEARAILAERDVDCLFLDISMPNENGFELLESLPDGKFSVIFVTAYNQFALKAIKANAVDYILKPVDIEELRAAVQRLCKQHQVIGDDPQAGVVYQQAISNALEDIKEKKEVTRLTLPQQSGLQIVDVQKIVFLEADSNYTIFYLKDGKRLVVAKTLKEFEEVLDEHTFVRIHKSHIINLAFLKTFSATNSNVTTATGDVLAVSRRRWSEFTEKVGAYSRRVK